LTELERPARGVEWHRRLWVADTEPISCVTADCVVPIDSAVRWMLPSSASLSSTWM
jgi:hypothetical protein